MSDQNKKDDTEPKQEKRARFLRRTIKVVIWGVAILALILFILSILRGKSDLYKDSMESFLSGVTGYTAEIENFENLSFYPLVGTTFEGLKFYTQTESGEPTQDVIASIDSVNVYLSFWDMFFSNGQVRTLEVKGLQARAGAFTDKALKIDVLAVEESDSAAPFVLAIRGALGNAELDVSAPARRIGKDFGFDFDKQVSLRLGDLQATGLLSENRNGEWEKIIISKSGQEVISGALNLGRKSGGAHIYGDFTVVQNGSQLRPDIVIKETEDGNRITGSVVAESFHFSDLSVVLDLIEDVEGLLLAKAEEGKALDFKGLDLDLDIDIKTLIAKTMSLGHVEGALTIKDNVLQWPISGTLSEGKLDGEVRLDATQSPFDFTLDAEVHDLDYGDFQRRVLENVSAEGTGDLKLALTSSGIGGSDIVPNLKGKASYIGGKGRLNTSVLNLWGGGLLNALLPDFSGEDNLALNCMIMDFGVENGVAEANALFIDTVRVTVGGEGNYDIANNRLDFKLKPQTKDVALGDVASAVVITGPIENPSIAPSMLDLGAKIGGLLLGAVNPAFFAFTLTDFGLSDEHPCATYMQGKADSQQETSEEQEQKEEQKEEAAE